MLYFFALFFCRLYLVSPTFSIEPFNVDGEFTLDDVMLQIDCYAREAVGIGKARMEILSYGNDPDVDLDLKVKLDDVMITLTAYAESAAGLR